MAPIYSMVPTYGAHVWYPRMVPTYMVPTYGAHLRSSVGCTQAKAATVFPEPFTASKPPARSPTEQVGTNVGTNPSLLRQGSAAELSKRLSTEFEKAKVPSYGAQLWCPLMVMPTLVPTSVST